MAFVKFEVLPGFWSRYQHWKFQVWPARIWVVGLRGMAGVSTSKVKAPCVPEKPIWLSWLKRPRKPERQEGALAAGQDDRTAGGLADGEVAEVVQRQAAGHEAQGIPTGESAFGVHRANSRRVEVDRVAVGADDAAETYEVGEVARAGVGGEGRAQGRRKTIAAGEPLSTSDSIKLKLEPLTTCG
ncbi:MAG: hypothetical protein R3F17_09965 [Planctomycetota bacterium]